MLPLVSVVMPVRDGERYLEDAVRSVLDQSYSEIELIVVDDGSQDGTPGILRALAPGVRSVRQAPEGTAAAVNRGIELAAGSFFAFLDADDLWTPRKLELQMAALADDPTLDLALGHVCEFQSPELDDPQSAGPRSSRDPIPGLSKGTMLIRRASFARVGPFSTAWDLGDFVDWYARAQEAGLKADMLPEVLMLRRLHADNTTRRAADARIDYARIARAALHRRRARGTSR
jgi:glycosyltransferase involved in cell wall biosynthesis